jgi:hypothetical protein
MDNGHFTPQYEFIFAPNEVRMLDYILKMIDEKLTQEFHKLPVMRAFGHNKIQLQKINALGAAARDSKAHLDVDHLDVAALQSPLCSCLSKPEQFITATC